MNKLLALVIAVIGASTLTAQESQAPAPPQVTLSVYLDCQNTNCDFDYFRTELAMVNWVRDRAVSDVHLLVTAQQTGSGGREYSVTFLGLRQFAGVTDTLKYISPPASTDDEQRKGLARLFRLGLVRYFARTPTGAKITVTFPKADSGSTQTSTKRDPWRAWVFRTGVDGFTYGEQTLNEFNWSGNFEADRITSQWKTQLRVREHRSRFEQTYPTCDASNVCRDTTVVSKRESFYRSLTQVRSLTGHLSAGLRLEMTGSRFENHKAVYRAYPAIEYNIFPYSQSTRRQLRLEYDLGYARFEYNDTTVFNKLEESMPIHVLRMAVATRETWGRIDVWGSGTQYLNDPELYRLSIGTDFNIRLFKGFEVRAFGGYDKIRDQFNLAKKNYTPQEILTRQFQLGTGYSFYSGFGIQYTFGSIYNNVVNPRMN